MVYRLAAHHATTRLRQRRLRASYAKLVTADPPSRLCLPEITLPREEAWPNELRAALADLRAESQAALTHTVNLLGSGPVELGAEVDWHRDFKSGFRWPAVFYQDVVVTRLDDDSDAKVPWELSRGHQLVALGRAAGIFGEEEPALELESQLRSWIAANPPGIGINWTNAMEVAIRAVNWVWAITALELRRPMDQSLRPLVARTLAAHGRHIWHNLEGSPQLRSNHYLSDIVGLLVLGWVLPDEPLAKRWFAYARRSLEREARAQILSDGIDFEASLSYHGLVLELLLIARWVASAARRPLSKAFDERLKGMLRASLKLRHPDGRIPQFGDGDSGRVLPASSRRPPTHDNLLWTGAALFGSLVPAGTAAHEEVAFNFGLAAWRRTLAQAAAREVTDLPPAESFPAAGLHVLRGTRSHLAVRCGDVGQNGNGGHSHNDLLSFELSYGGQLVVADPGTFTYTAEPRERNRFRSTAVHNTVLVDGEEINPIDERALFCLARWARPLPHRLRAAGEVLELVCAHDGYRRLRPPVVVRRTFLLNVRSAELSVTDDIVGDGEHSVCSHIQLCPGWIVARESPAQFSMRRGSADLSLEVFGHTSATVSDGWVSSHFGIRERAPSIEIKALVPQTRRFGYRITSALG